MGGNFAFPDFSGTQFERDQLMDDPRAAFGRFAEGRTGGFLQYLLNNYNKYALGYASQSARTPTASFLDYLTGSAGGADPYRDYQNLSPAARGERPTSYLGRVRFLGV